jgi:hypothetical protein
MATKPAMFSPQDLKTLEQTRQRLFQLTRNLSALQTAMMTTQAPGGVLQW